MLAISSPALGRLVRDDDLASRPEPAEPLAPSLADPTLSEQALAHSPALVVGLVVLWIALGVSAAGRLRRRGHEARSVTALGVVLGPFLIGYDRLALRPQRHHAQPVVVAAPTPFPGATRVVVAVLGAAERAADAETVLRLSRESLADVRVVTPLPYEVATEVDHPDRDAALRRLRQAAQFLGDVEPGLVLVPGRGIDAVTAYLADDPADVLVVTGAPTVHASLSRDHAGRAVSITTDGRDAATHRPTTR